jgi:fimbrial chaperone protein
MRTIIFILLVTLPQTTWASFDFSPVITSVAPSGAQSTTSFTVSNDNDTKLPVQLYIVHRKPDIDGKEEYKETPDIDELFQVYPSQLILAPKEKRTVRVSWVGDPNPKTELAFRIIAEEMPFSVEDPNKVYTKAVAEVKLASKYVGSLYVTPQGVMPMLEFSASTTDGKQLVLEVVNKGTAPRKAVHQSQA